MQSLRRIVNNRNNIQSRALEEHLQIIEAFLLADEAQAAEAMSRHITSTAAGVERVMLPSEGVGQG